MAQYDVENIYGNLGCPKGGLVASSSFKIVIIGVDSVSIFYEAKYYGDKVRDMLDCPKDVLAA